MNPLEAAADHARGAAYTLEFMAPQFAKDEPSQSMAAIRLHLDDRGLDGDLIAVRLRRARDAAHEAIREAERALKALDRAYRRADRA